MRAFLELWAFSIRRPLAPTRRQPFGASRPSSKPGLGRRFWAEAVSINRTVARQKQRHTKMRENSRARAAGLSSERRAPALRGRDAAPSRGAGAPRSGRQMAGVRASVSSKLIFGVGDSDFACLLKE